MLSPIYYENCTEAILAEYARLEDAILSAMIRRMLKMGFVSDSTKHQAEMLQNAGLLYNDIIDIIAQHTNATKNQVKTLFEDAGVETVDIDNEVYREAGNVPVDIRQSDSMRQVLEAGFRKTMGIMDNLTKTTAVTTQKMFYDACNDAYMQITSGAFSYSEAVRNAIRRAAQGGLTVKYPTGHTDKLDVAVRRAALTGVGQTCAEIGKMNAEEMGCYLMEISAHSGARPDHAKWQGQLVTLTGQDAGKIIDGMKVFTLHKIGYGTGAGFRGWNCRHDWYPYFPGISVPNYSKQELEKLNARDIEWNGEKYTEYEITQMQRAQERKIRELKRQTVKMQDAADFATDPKLKELAKADHQVMSVKLKAAEQDLKRFCNATGQDRDKFREQVLGFSRSEAQRAVQANKKASLINWLTTVDEDGKIDIENFKNALGKGYVNTTIEKSQQQKHQSGKAWKNQVKQAMQSGGKQIPKSRLFKNIDPQKIVDDYGGTGVIATTKNNKCIDEFITLSFEVGVTFDRAQSKYVKTHRLQIKYTKNGTHIFPTKEMLR